jgi:uncharacterized protein YacL
MNVSLNFIRIIFFLLSVFFMSVYMTGRPGNVFVNLLYGGGIGAVFGFTLLAFSYYFRKFNLRSFNILVIGIFFGYFLGLGLTLIFDGILEISRSTVTGEVLENLDDRVTEMIKVGLYLFGIFLGCLLTLRAADELYVSIPFVKFTPLAQKKKDIILDVSVLKDVRIIDLAASGLLDSHLVIPRFIMKDLYASAETGDETRKFQARRCLEVVKKLEINTELDVRFNDTDFPEASDLANKMIRLARLLDANILSADVTKVQMATIEGVKIVNIHTLSNALKPLTQSGETIHIKVQRYGKEPRQGVGYLEDGTMVVINGGGNYIGQTIEANVLSVKHTSSGRMIFCNVLDDEHEEIEEDDE